MERRREQRLCVGIAGAVAVALLGACGGEEPVAATGRMMGATEARSEQPGNEAPTLERVILEPRAPRPGTNLVARVVAHDPDGDPVEIDYAWRIAGRQVASSGSALPVPADAAKGTDIEVEVTARDREAESEPMRAVVRVGNRPPVLSRVWIQPAEGVAVNEELIAVAEGTDPDGDRLEFSFSWFVNGRPVPGDGARFRTTDTQRGDKITARARVSDGDDETPPKDSAPVLVRNSAPRIVSAPPGPSQDGRFRYVIEAQDPDGDRNLRYALVTGPDGARIDPVLGEVTWTASADRPGAHGFEIVVEDAHGGKTQQRFEVDVQVVEGAATSSETTPAAIE